jgi:hypothetical protein
VGSLKWKIAVQPSLDKKQDPISKITRAKWAVGLAQAVEHKHSKHKALSSKSITEKNKMQCQLT